MFSNLDGFVRSLENNWIIYATPTGSAPFENANGNLVMPEVEYTSIYLQELEMDVPSSAPSIEPSAKDNSIVPSVTTSASPSISPTEGSSLDPTPAVVTRSLTEEPITPGPTMQPMPSPS